MKTDSTPRWTAAQHEPIKLEGRERWLGRYRLCFEVAAGGMATVYLARAKGAAGFEKPVAVKRVHPHLARERSFVEMFLDEARLAAQIDHPNTCTVFDFGEADGSFFMAMEFLVGEPLSRVLRAMHKVSPDDSFRRPAWVARIVADAAEGLHAAHELTDADGKSLEVIHRDVSPQNLFVTYDGHVKVVDFGIAYARDRLQHTRTGQLKGKMSYVAPEQLEARPVDRRADIWALGVVAWEALTGRRLFKRESEVATMRAILDEPIATPSNFDREISPALDATVLRALERDPDRRWPTARAFSQELNRILVDHRISYGAAEVASEMDRLFPGGGRAKRALVERAVDMTAVDAMVLPATPGARGNPDLRSARRFRFGFAAMVVAVVAFFAAVGLGAGDGEVAAGGYQAPPPPSASEDRSGHSAEPANARPVREPNLAVPSPETAASRGGRETADVGAAEAPQKRRRRMRARPLASGRVAITTPGGWATVYLSGRRLGETPGVLELPAGRHVLSVRPNDQAPYKRIPVRVAPGRTARVRVDLR